MAEACSDQLTEERKDQVLIAAGFAADGEAKRRNWLKRRRQKICKKKTLHRKLPITEWLPNYTLRFLAADMVAGITVGATVIPQALAYATVGGLPPQYGLYSAFVGCFVYVFLGSTAAVTIGPTTLLALLSYDAATSIGPEAAVLLAFLSGCVQLAVGLLNFGFLIDFIAAPVIVGFTASSAITIAMTQVKSLLGLKFQAEGFIETWVAIFEHISETRLWDSVMGFSSIVALILLRRLGQVKLEAKGNRWKRVGNKIIWFLSTARNAVVILICSTIAALLPGTDYVYLTGNITAGLPPFQPPPFSLESGNQTLKFGEIFQTIGPSIFIVALIGVLESVAVAKAFAGGKKVYASQEMIAIGASNVLGSFFSSIPVTGSFSRTAVNVASGVCTPMGGIYTGSLVLLASSVLTPYFYYIPKCCLAAVICMAVIAMVEVHVVKQIWRTQKLDLVPLAVTFLVCLLFSLEFGILIGAGAKIGMELYTSSRPKLSIRIIKGTRLDYVLITPDRSLIFSSMDYFATVVRKAASRHRHPDPLPVVIDFTYVSTADYSTADSFRLLGDALHKEGHRLVLDQVKPQLQSTLLGLKPKHLDINPRDGNVNSFLEGLVPTDENQSTEATSCDLSCNTNLQQVTSDPLEPQTLAETSKELSIQV